MSTLDQKYKDAADVDKVHFWYVGLSALLSPEHIEGFRTNYTYELAAKQAYIDELDNIILFYLTLDKPNTSYRSDVKIYLFDDTKTDFQDNETTPFFLTRTLKSTGLQNIVINSRKAFPSHNDVIISSNSGVIDRISKSGGIAIEASPDNIITTLTEMLKARSISHHEQRKRIFGTSFSERVADGAGSLAKTFCNAAKHVGRLFLRPFKKGSPEPSLNSPPPEPENI